MTIEAFAILSVGLLIFFISLPLMYRKVPMNSLYGIRIPAAFESDQRWYDINAFGGRQMAAWSWLITVTGAIGFLLPNNWASIYLPASTVVVLLAVLVPLMRIIQWSGRLPKTETAACSTPQNAGEENVQASGISQTYDLLKMRNLIPAMVLMILAVGYLVFIANSVSGLPDRVATHFDAGGRPNGWMPRQSYLHFITVLGLSLAVVIAGMAFVLGILSSRLSAAPFNHRSASGRRNQKVSWLCSDILWFACLVLCFIAGTHFLTIVANRARPPHLPTAPLAILIAGFGIGNIGWIILLCFHLTRKPDAAAVTEMNTQKPG